MVLGFRWGVELVHSAIRAGILEAGEGRMGVIGAG
jgi:hypothetical protein